MEYPVLTILLYSESDMVLKRIDPVYIFATNIDVGKKNFRRYRSLSTYSWSQHVSSCFTEPVIDMTWYASISETTVRRRRRLRGISTKSDGDSGQAHELRALRDSAGATHQLQPIGVQFITEPTIDKSQKPNTHGLKNCSSATPFLCPAATFRPHVNFPSAPQPWLVLHRQRSGRRAAWAPAQRSLRRRCEEFSELPWWRLRGGLGGGDT